MKTKHKIALATIAYRTIGTFRKIAGAGDEVTVTRRGIRYHLDLSEGIDLAIYLQGQFEPDTALACSRYIKPGETVLDIGANIGAHTLSLAKLLGETGRVLAFEPTNYAFAKLTRNLALNPDLARRIETFQCFLGPSHEAELPKAIYASWPLKGGAQLHAEHLGQPMTTEGAQVRSLDTLLSECGISRVDFVKLDVDGHEAGVLAGAQKMLQRDRPTILMEFAPYLLAEHGVNPRKVYSQLTAYGYRFYGLMDDSGRPQSLDDLFVSVGSPNIEKP